MKIPRKETICYGLHFFFFFNLCSKFEYIQKNNIRKLSSFSTLTHKKYDVIKIDDIINFNCVGGEILNKFLSKIVAWGL